MFLMFNIKGNPAKLYIPSSPTYFRLPTCFCLLLGMPLRGVDEWLGLIRNYFIHIAPDPMNPATGETDSMVLTCWISAVVGGPTLTQYWVNVLRFLIGYQSQLLTGKHWLRLTFNFKSLDSSLTWPVTRYSDPLFQVCETNWSCWILFNFRKKHLQMLMFKQAFRSYSSDLNS